MMVNAGERSLASYRNFVTSDDLAIRDAEIPLLLQLQTETTQLLNLKPSHVAPM